METAQLITEAVAATGKVTAGLSAGVRSNITPCAGFDVHGLAGHMAGVYAGSALAGRKEGRPAGDSSPDLLGDNPAAALADPGSKLADAWGTPGAFEGTTKFGPGEMPAQMAGAITFFETLVHGWDFAKATGQEFQISDELAAASLVVAQQICNEVSRERGAFGPEVQVSADANAFDRALGLSGRDPGWSGRIHALNTFEPRAGIGRERS